MSPRGLRRALAACLLAAVAAVISTTAQEQQLVLRSSATSVAVHVLVESATKPAKPVRDLTAKDFVVTDSGVKQEIAAMTTDVLPLDVTVVLDRLEQSEYAKRIPHPQVVELESLLNKDDRLRVVAVGSDIEETLPLGPPGRGPAPLPRLKSDLPALFDGVATALIRPTPPGRHHLVVAITEGFDAYSFTGAAALADIAHRSDAQLNVIVAEGRRLKTRTLARVMNPLPIDDSLGSLVEIAKSTGGDVIASYRLTRSIGGPVKHLFDEVRAGYVLYYTPTGATDRGWHPIEVTIARPGNFEVRARRGYAN
ncbi:MAG TPA: hypothetical protein VN700_01600 [Vicinamibacterales bacterium]|nr:hypothetical protein [Vicinamibacterales bacterium]